MVRKCVEQYVVINWYENFNRDVIKFLKALDVVNCSEVAIKTIEALLKLVHFNFLYNILDYFL